MNRIPTDKLINIFRYRLIALFGNDCDGIRDFNDFFNTYEFYRIVETSNEREILEDKEQFCCRFCGKNKQTGATFNTTSHLVSQLFGKPNLTSTYECDECNNLFKKYETDLGNWTLIERAFLGQRTKKGKKATYKQGGVSLQNRKESKISKETPQKIRDKIKNDTVIYYKSNQTKPEEKGKEDTFTLELKTPSYIPINVFKSFVKIALGLVLQKDLEEFKETINWLISEPEEQKTRNLFKIFVYRYKQVINFFEHPVIWLFRKRETKNEDKFYNPKWVYVMFSGNSIYQIFLPFSKSDIEMRKKTTKMETLLYPPILNPGNFTCFCKENKCISAFDSVLLNYGDFGGIEKVKNATKSMTLESQKK